MDSIVSLYAKAKTIVLSHGYSDEINWQSNRNLNSLTESEFLCEYAWVILCSGFRESILRKKFNFISLCFCDWSSANDILNNANICRDSALHVFANKQKMDAIIDTANIIHNEGFTQIVENISNDPLNELQIFPFIGPITCFHLAKNIGIDIAKPDRHLTRLANEYNISNVQKLCSNLSEISGDPIPIVDMILWRYSTIHNQIQT